MTDLNMGTTMSLSGQVALVTGGGTGIGLMIAKGFAANGAKVYITGRRVEVLNQAAAAFKDVRGTLVPLEMDVTSQASIEKAVQHIQEADGKLDVLVNNAGTAGPTIHDPEFYVKKQATLANGGDTYDHETFEGWAELFTINTSAPFFVIKAFRELLTKGAQARNSFSAVINISSLAVDVRSWVYVGSFAYHATKAALDKMSISLATDFAKTNVPIRVNVIHPGVFPSEAAPELADSIATMVLPGWSASAPQGRAGTIRDMAMTATYLATSEYTNGAVVSVDGGLALVNP